jgi:hypothetical protein
MVLFFGRIAFFALATSVFAGERLTALVTAAQDFSVAIQEQLAAVQSDISAKTCRKDGLIRQSKNRLLQCVAG